MSKITTAYDALKTRVATVLPNHKELSDPYDPQENSEHLLKKGYGIVIGGGLNSNRAIGCVLSMQRTMLIVLTRKFYAAEMDRDAKVSAEKELLEDQKLVLKDIENDPDLGTTNVVARFVFVSDDGVQKVFTEGKPFISLTSSFILEYLEDLT